MGMTFRYRAVVVKEGKGYWSYIPRLKGVYGVGRSESAARKDLQEALQLYLEVCRDEKELPPRPHARVSARDEVTATV
jgi:predicted RNase H-like HicB family nuclease